MKKNRTPVREEDRAKILLWCARHCCFCGKACTTNIVVHHIDGNPQNNAIDNLIPVCFDCHGELERYNLEHPLGTKYRHLEIKTRREQIYELYTRDYLRPVEIKISRYNLLALEQTGQRNERPWGDISCSVRTLSRDISLRLELQIKPYHNGKPMKAHLADLYAGLAKWNLIPNFTVHGHFELPISRRSRPFHYRVEIFWTIVDVLGRAHDMLPFSYVWTDPKGDWWYDPRVLYDY